MNMLLELRQLTGCYSVMRHGHSEANQQGIIVSDPQQGCVGFGLSERGRQQVELAVLDSDYLNRDTLIISSDFKRAKETAQILHRRLQCNGEIKFEKRLRERSFGDLDMGPDSNYASVWQQDLLNANNAHEGVESPNRVMRRVTSLVLESEQTMPGRTFLLVSHGDALQILQAAFEGLQAAQHRSLDPLATAEIRHLHFGAW